MCVRKGREMILILAVCETCRNTHELHHIDFTKVACKSCGSDIENDTVINKAAKVASQDIKDTEGELSIMKRNVKELQECLGKANKRIKYLNDLVSI